MKRDNCSCGVLHSNEHGSFQWPKKKMKNNYFSKTKETANTHTHTQLQNYTLFLTGAIFEKGSFYLFTALKPISSETTHKKFAYFMTELALHLTTKNYISTCLRVLKLVGFLSYFSLPSFVMNLLLLYIH